MAATRLHYIRELDGLRNRLLEMSSEADSMLMLAIRALAEQDERLVEEVLVRDDIVDGHNLTIEGECMRLIALQQPLARDLRLVITIMKVITDLERIGDHAVDIAKIARKLTRDAFFKPLVDLPRMAGAVRTMLNGAMLAFVNNDLEQVDAVVEADDDVDALYHQLRDELHAIMRLNPLLAVQASYLLFVTHHLERIADHTVNIAERVHYVETGRLVPLAKTRKIAW